MDRTRLAPLPLALAALLVAVAVTACTSGPSAASPTPATPLASVPASGTPTDQPAASAEPTRTIPRVSALPSPGAGEVPADVVAAVVADAAARLGVDAASIVVVETDAVTWPNGALGCPSPGNAYTDALEPGYRVVVESGGTRLDYRGGSSGNLRVCENPPGPG